MLISSDSLEKMLALENLSQVSQFACALPGLQGFLSSPKLIELEWSHDFCSLRHPHYSSFSIVSPLTNQAIPNAKIARDSSHKTGWSGCSHGLPCRNWTRKI